jgi:hypothetical protein
MMNPSPSDIEFQRLLKRSDQVFRQVRSILTAQTRDVNAMTRLVVKGKAIAADLSTATEAKQRVYKVL